MRLLKLISHCEDHFIIYPQFIYILHIFVTVFFIKVARENYSKSQNQRIDTTQIHVTGAKRGKTKTCVAKSPLVLASHLIGGVDGDCKWREFSKPITELD